MTGDRAADEIDASQVGIEPSLLARVFGGPAPTYALTRFAILRLLGLVYLVAFLVAARQFEPLIGHDGLLPADAFLDHVARLSGSRGAGFWRVPSLFWLGASDAALGVAAWIGVAIAAAVTAGATNAFLQVALWALYLSFVHVGQVFYGYGWESQLSETGFLAIFLCPIATIVPFPKAQPAKATIVLFRWLAVRIMLGAGLIKLRGDPCWRDLSCLVYHYETQPNPSPISWLLHQAPPWFHAIGALVNHAVEVVAPFFAFGPRRARRVAGIAMVGFQVFLVLSGNLSFLNWLTIVPAIACLDDEILGRLFPKVLRERVIAAAEAFVASRLQRGVAVGLALVVGVLSVGPIENLLSSRQRMNTSFEPFDLVNSYGAFGSVSRERLAVILEGTADETIDAHTRWREYELPCAPGDVARRPCFITPYHLRFDWQIWFTQFGAIDRQPWLAEAVAKLLNGDRGIKTLFAVDPFPDAPPRFVRGEVYRYRFTRLGDGNRAWWTRERVDSYFRPLSRDDPALREFLRANDLAPP